MAETLMLGLRLLEGVDRHAFADRFGQDPVDAFSRTVRRYTQLSALLVTPDRLRIAEDALFVADSILADILAEAGGNGQTETAE
jgi:oxygen-independent coproporphyrinogen-3 oxidase